MPFQSEQISLNNHEVSPKLIYALNQAAMLHSWMVEQGFVEGVDGMISWELGETKKFTFTYMKGTRPGRLSCGVYYPNDLDVEAVVSELQVETDDFHTELQASRNESEQMQGKPILARLSDGTCVPVGIMQPNGDFESTLSFDLLFSPQLRPIVMETVWKEHSAVATQRLLQDSANGITWSNWEKLLRQYFDYLAESARHDPIFQYANHIYATSANKTTYYDEEYAATDPDTHAEQSYANTSESIEFFMDHAAGALNELDETSIIDDYDRAIEAINRSLRFLAAGASGSVGESSPMRDIDSSLEDLLSKTIPLPTEHIDYMNDLRQRNKQTVDSYMAVWNELRELATNGIHLVLGGYILLNVNYAKSTHCPVLPHSEGIPAGHHIFHQLAEAIVRKPGNQ
jgi:hypothetical protein